MVIVFPTMLNITILELSPHVELRERERREKREISWNLHGDLFISLYFSGFCIDRYFIHAL